MSKDEYKKRTNILFEIAIVDLVLLGFINANFKEVINGFLITVLITVAFYSLYLFGRYGLSDDKEEPENEH